MTKLFLCYEAPTTEVVEVKFEGVVCQSLLGDPSDYLNGGDPFAGE